MGPAEPCWHPVCHVGAPAPALDAPYPMHTHEYLWYLCISNGTAPWLPTTGTERLMEDKSELEGWRQLGRKIKSGGRDAEGNLQATQLMVLTSTKWLLNVFFEIDINLIRTSDNQKMKTNLCKTKEKSWFCNSSNSEIKITSHFFCSFITLLILIFQNNAVTHVRCMSSSLC